MKTQKDSKKKAELDEKSHRERLEILQKTREIAGRQLTVSGFDGSLKEIDELKNLINNNIEDPTQKHELYYNGVQNLLRKYLPQDDSFSEARGFIYDEKNIFLTRGKAKDRNGVRGADSRMTYNQDLKELVELIAKWIMEGQDAYSLYLSLYDLNERYGYGHQYYDETSKYFKKERK